MDAGLSTKNAPSPKIVLPHYAFGAISFTVALIMLFFASGDLTAHYLSPKLLSVTHVLVLGWITMIIFGALYQLIPVVMEVRLFSEKLALATFVLFGAGLIILSASFWTFTFSRSTGLEVGGFMIIISILMFGINTILSAAKTQRRTIENTFIVTSIVWLLIAVTIGLLIVLNFGFHFIPGSHLQLLKMHAHLGVIGWFLLLVIGVASKLMPMFLIVHKLPRKLLNISFYLVNSGLIILATGYYFLNEIWFLSTGSILVIGGIIAFLRFNFIAFSKRIRKKLDVGLKMSASAFILLAVSIIFGLVSVLRPEILSQVQNRIDISYGILIILGFLSALVLGQTYKTLPFIVWLKKYQTKVGKAKVPLPMELYSDRIAHYHFYTYLAGIILLMTGVLLSSVSIVSTGTLLLIITAVLYNYNVFKIIFHNDTSNES